jgi:hypothetical protein
VTGAPGAASGAEEPPRYAGRLDGPNAGWMAMERRLGADLTVADAEAYAAGERRLTVHHGLQHRDLIDELIDVVDDAIRRFPGATGSPFTSLGPSGGWTRWRFRPPAAAEQLAAARAAITRDHPGWRVEADEH